MRRSWLVIGTAIAIAVVLVGCSSSKKTPTATPGATLTPEATAAATAASAATGTVAPTSAAGATLKTAQNATLGTILTDAAGKTLYTYGSDTAGVSNCNAGCISVWPALTASGTPTGGAGVTGTLATIQRSDGTTQVTYNGMPLYYFLNDTATGDANGDGVNSFHVAKP